MKKRHLLRSVALTALIASPAIAEDMPVKAPPATEVTIPNWTGYYMGLNAGGAWAKADPSTNAVCGAAPGFTFGYFDVPLGGCANALPVDAAGTGSASRAAFIGGGQAGYNVQKNNAVFGVEVDFNSFNIKATRQVTGSYTTVPNTFTVASSAETDWLLTARGRAGWSFGNVLVYATGGLAVTDLENGNSFADNFGFFPGPGVGAWSASATKFGWTVGGGLEWALNQHWSAKVEYLYVKFGSVAASGLVTGSSAVPGVSYANAIGTSVDLTASIARAGVNYKF